MAAGGYQIGVFNRGARLLEGMNHMNHTAPASLPNALLE